MNAPLAGKMIVLAAGLFLLGPVACAGGGADAALTDAAGPLEPRVEALIDANRRYPRWENFPVAPQDVPDAGHVAARVTGLAGDSAALSADVAALNWTLADVNAYLAAAAARSAPPTSPDSARLPEEIEALARALRDRGRAPPPIPRR